MAASCSGDEDSQNRSNWRRSKPSKRIDAARFFLKNISLDGKAIDGPLQWDSKHTNGDSMFEGGLGRLHTRRLSQRQDTFEDDKKLILDLPTTSKVQLHHSTSVACTNIFKESSLKSQKAGDSVILAKSKSYVETASAGSSGKDRLNSQVSQQKPNIHLLDSRQFLTRSLKYMFGKRAVLISPNGLPIGSISVIPYKKEDKHSHLAKEKRASSGPHQANSNAITIEGVEVGDIKRTVSYSHMLVPAMPLRRRKITFQTDLLDESTHQAGREHSGSSSDAPYHPFLLDDPELTSGKHRKVLNLKSYTVSVIQYAKPVEIKKDINERFKERFPNTNITLSKLRSIKLEMFEVGMKCGVDNATIACAHIYFEKLVLKEKVTKANRKCCAGACLLLASKFNGDIKKGSFSPIIETINDRLRLHLKDLLAFELLVLIALEFQLCLSPSEVNPMFKRLESMRKIVKSRNRYNHRSQYHSRNTHHREVKS